MQWKSEYSIGIPEIDREHQKLVTCVSKIEEAVAKGAGWSTLHFALETLVSCTTDHFAIEESIMRIQQYPQLDDHIVGHVEFLQRLERLENQSLAGPLTKESIEFLQPWLEEHFVVDDKHYASYLSGKKRRSA